MACGAAPPAEKGMPKWPKLYALLVGVDDYSKSKTTATNLKTSVASTRRLADALRARAASSYASVQITTLTDSQVTAKAVLRQLDEIGDAVRLDDQVILLLAGHAGSVEVDFVSRSGRVYHKWRALGGTGRRLIVPSSFRFDCYDSDPMAPNTYISSRKLFTTLARIKGRVLVLLDTCHGTAPSTVPSVVDPEAGGIRDTSSGRLNVIWTASASSQGPLKPLKPNAKFPYSLFVISVVN